MLALYRLGRSRRPAGLQRVRPRLGRGARHRAHAGPSRPGGGDPPALSRPDPRPADGPAVSHPGSGPATSAHRGVPLHRHRVEHPALGRRPGVDGANLARTTRCWAKHAPPGAGGCSATPAMPLCLLPDRRRRHRRRRGRPGRPAGEPWAPTTPCGCGWRSMSARQSAGGQLFRADPHRTARLLAGAWGGQIVMLAAAADLAADQLPEGISLVDLGEQGLADLARPERVFQVAQAALPAEFPRSDRRAPATTCRPPSRPSWDGVRDQRSCSSSGDPGSSPWPGPGARQDTPRPGSGGCSSGALPEGACWPSWAPVRDPPCRPEVAAALGLDPVPWRVRGAPSTKPSATSSATGAS